MTWLLLTLACGTSSAPPASTTEDPTAPAEAVEAEPTNPLDAARKRLTEAPPALGAVGQAYANLAKEMGMGAVQCPAAGSSRVRRIYGTARDRLDLGIAYRIAQEEDPIPWSPYFDDVAIEDGWVVILAEPESTSGYLRTFAAIQKMTWPPVKAGELTTCTEIEAMPTRTVSGRLEVPEEGAVDGTCMTKPVRLAKDGTFFIETRPPCSLWVVTDSKRSATIAIPADSAEKMDLGTLNPPADPYQDAEGSWSEKGRARVTELIKAAESEIEARRQLIQKMETEEKAAGPALGFWKGSIVRSERDVKMLQTALNSD